MKRIGNLYNRICSLENLFLADRKARKGKGFQYGVTLHARNWEPNLYSLHHRLHNRTYQTSEYSTFFIYEPKEREVYRLPYFPDRITHHAVMNVLEPIFVRMFTADTYSCIKGKGIHGAVYALKAALRDQEGTRYFLKMDIRKFYPSVNLGTLKHLLRRKFKDEGLLWLLEEIIDSAPGLPIGNYLSQYFANFYLTGFDHWLKEVKGVKYYFRYADDLVILGSDKSALHALRAAIEEYLQVKLKLQLKKNYRVAPVDAQGIDFVGYVFFHTHILLRKTIKQNFARMMAKRPNLASLASYNGWAVHCNSRHLIKALYNEHLRKLQHQHASKPLQRGQNKDRTHSQSGNPGDCLSHRALQIFGQRERQATETGFPARERGSHRILQLNNHDGADPPGAG